MTRWTVRGRKRVLGAGMVLVLAVIVAVAGLTMLSKRDTPTERAAASAGQQEQANAPSHAGHTGHAARAPSAVRNATPAQATLQLQALIGQHSVLSADMMRGRLRGDPDFAQAANAALTKNTDAMAELVGSLFGADAQRQFATLWATHVTALFNYARGLADNDQRVRDEARAVLNKYESDLATFFASASKGRLARPAAETGLHTHVHHLLDQADAYAAGDYDRAAQLYRQAYAHSFGLGTAVAMGLLGPGPVGAIQTAGWRLQSELGRLLGEHVALVVSAIRAGTANAPDFPAAGEALDGNTRELAAAIDSLYGAAAAKSFQSLWADHIDQVVSYTAGVATGDAARRAAAQARLDTFQRRLAAFLQSATGGRLASPALTQALLMHDRMLLREVDALAAKDYQKAHDIAYDTYQHMFELAGQLSTAIGATIAARLPKGGAETGGGGTAAVVGRR